MPSIKSTMSQSNVRSRPARTIASRTPTNGRSHSVGSPWTSSRHKRDWV
ncbi:hypothetical protein [Lysobacter gummosus]